MNPLCPGIYFLAGFFAAFLAGFLAAGFFALGLAAAFLGVFAFFGLAAFFLGVLAFLGLAAAFFLGVLAFFALGFLGLAALGFFAFLGLTAFFLAASPRRKLPEAPDPLACFRLLFFTPAQRAIFRWVLTLPSSLPTLKFFMMYLRMA